jgi:hypothetical protein
MRDPGEFIQSESGKGMDKSASRKVARSFCTAYAPIVAGLRHIFKELGLVAATWAQGRVQELDAACPAALYPKN